RSPPTDYDTISLHDALLIFTGGIHILVKAYSWIRAMGADGIKEAADISVLANHYMEKRIMNMRGVTRSHDHLKVRRMEMTRFSLQQLYEDTGVTAEDVQARMTDLDRKSVV